MTESRRFGYFDKLELIQNHLHFGYHPDEEDGDPHNQSGGGDSGDGGDDGSTPNPKPDPKPDPEPNLGGLSGYGDNLHVGPDGNLELNLGGGKLNLGDDDNENGVSLGGLSGYGDSFSLTSDGHLTVKAGSLYGGMDLDSIGIYQDGVYTTSTLGITHDQHIYRDGTEYGIVAEFVADVAESLFDTAISESTAAALDAAGKIVMVAIAITSVPTAIAMIASGVPGLMVAGVLSLASTVADIKDLGEFLQDHFAFSPNTTTEVIMHEGGDSDGLARRITAIAKADREQELGRLGQLSALLDYDYYKYMAGGEVYQGVFAGGDFFDATTAPDTSFSVGKPYSMSSNARRIHIPYAHFLPKNMAGNKNFSILF